MIALCNRYIGMSKLLIKRGADLKIPLENNRTILILAASTVNILHEHLTSYLELLKLIIDTGIEGLMQEMIREKQL